MYNTRINYYILLSKLRLIVCGLYKTGWIKGLRKSRFIGHVDRGNDDDNNNNNNNRCCAYYIYIISNVSFMEKEEIAIVHHVFMYLS